MMNNIPTPPALTGSEMQQLLQMRSYLFRISEMLNAALSEQNVTIQTVVDQQQSGVTKESLEKENTSQYNRLKSLIVKTADEVESEIVRVETEIRQQYIAKSEWGTYEENIQQQMVTTAENVVQSFGYDAALNEVREGVADFEAYKLKTDGYIQSGIIGYDDDGLPVIGIAIGQDLKSKEVEIGGEVYVEIDMTKNLATYTSERITFWQNGVEVAYISNSEMGITIVVVNDKIILGGKWENSHIYGYAVKWIGG